MTGNLTLHILVLSTLVGWTVSAISVAQSSEFAEITRTEFLISGLQASLIIVSGGLYIVMRFRRPTVPTTLFDPVARLIAVFAGMVVMGSSWPGTHFELKFANLLCFRLMLVALLLNWTATHITSVPIDKCWEHFTVYVNRGSRILFSLLFFLLGAEAAVRLLEPALSQTHLSTSHTDYETWTKAHSRPDLENEIPKLFFNDTNWASSKPDDTIRIAALGDSFAFGYVGYSDNYLTLTEKGLNSRLEKRIEILNFGQIGTNPKDYLVMLDRVALGFNPDIVLVNFFVGNDFYVLNQYGSITVAGITLPCVNTGNLIADKFHWKNWHSIQFGRILSTMTNSLSERALNPPTKKISFVSQTNQILSDSRPTYTEEAYLSLLVGKIGMFKKMNASSLRARWEKVRPMLQLIQEMCIKHSLTMAVTILPDEFQVVQSWRKRALNQAKLSELDIDIFAPNKMVREFCEQRAIPVLDMLEDFQIAAESEQLYIPMNTHWNLRGNHLAAKILTPFISDEVMPLHIESLAR